jgi:DNA-directed RNA polymerase specialized sigma24 family protein
MKYESITTQESFDALLAWLDPDRNEAGQKYEDIRRRLIKIFCCRGCYEPEDLADETISRVTKKLREIESTYTGDRRLYFFGVANRVHLEYVRKPVPSLSPPPVKAPDEVEAMELEYACLEHCLQRLTPENRELVLQYYQDEKRAKIDHRKNLAEKLGIALNALRIRAHRIRLTLEKCLQECMSQQLAG